MIEIALLLTVALQAPPPPPPPPRNPLSAPRDVTPDRKGTAVVRGHVFSQDGRPLRRAQIRLTSPDLRTPLTTSTGLDGEFEVRDVPAIRAILHVSRSGYIPLQYGQAAPGEPGEVLEIKDRVVLDKLRITLLRAGAISGQVTDETGEPAAGVDIWAMQEQFFRGSKRMVPVSNAAPHLTTDESGQYRLTGLVPGEYLVMAVTRETWMSDDKEPRMVSFAPTYYPGTANPSEGRRVKVAGGQEIGAVDIALTSIRTARISGTAMAADGAPMSGSVMLMHEFMGPMGGRMSMSGNARIGPDGGWQIADLPPGEYTIRASDTRLGETATRRVTVAGSDIDGLHLSADPGALISGRVVTESGAPLPSGRFTVSTVTPLPFEAVLPRTTPGKDDGVVDGTGSFVRRTVAGEVIARLAGLPRGWFLRSVIIGDRDYEGVPISVPPGGELREITLVISDRLPVVSGSVSDAEGRPAAANVVLFSVDPARWLEAAGNQKMLRTGADGRYRFEGVRPGEYYVIALGSMQRWQMNDPDFLRPQQERATRITVADTDLAADLRLVR